MQQGRGSLRSQLLCVLCGGRGSPSRCSRAAGLPSVAVRALYPGNQTMHHIQPQRGTLPSGAAEQALPSVAVKTLFTSFWVSLPIQHRTGLSLMGQRSCSSLRRSESPPSVASIFKVYSALDRALLSGAAEPQIPYIAVRALHLML